jgi:hypothetical protein
VPEVAVSASNQPGRCKAQERKEQRKKEHNRLSLRPPRSLRFDFALAE